MVAERTRALNRLHVLLRDLLSDVVGRQLSADAAAKLLRRARPKHPAGRVRRRLASELVRDVRALDRRITVLDERIAAEVEASGTTLTEIFGVGPILAAKIIGVVGDVARFPSTRRTSPPTRGWRRWRPQEAGGWSDTGSRSPGTAPSTR